MFYKPPSYHILFMASHNSELITQFTEDAFANEDRICQRPSCASKIHKGEPCFYIATIVHGQSGRFVCGACHRRYQGKVATGVRPTGTAGQPLPDPQRIRQSVNAGQRSCPSSYCFLSSSFADVIISQHLCNHLLWLLRLMDILGQVPM